MRNLRYFVLLCTAFFWGLSVSAQNKVASYHTIQKGETLFRLTQIYQVTAESICALNPGLSAENFQAGKTIAIPAPNGEVEKAKTIEVLESSRPEGVADNCREMYKVKRKETIYSISKKFEITGEGLLARALCHEIDHLDGIIYVDKMDHEIFDDDEEEKTQEEK